MRYEFTLYSGPERAVAELSQEQKDAIVDRVMKYYEDHDCVFGEGLHQSDDCIIDAPGVLSDILDNIVKFEIVE